MERPRLVRIIIMMKGLNVGQSATSPSGLGGMDGWMDGWMVMDVHTHHTARSRVQLTSIKDSGVG